MTGQYPISIGFQHECIQAGSPWGLPLDIPIMPQVSLKTTTARANMSRGKLDQHECMYIYIYSIHTRFQRTRICMCMGATVGCVWSLMAHWVQDWTDDLTPFFVRCSRMGAITPPCLANGTWVTSRSSYGLPTEALIRSLGSRIMGETRKNLASTTLPTAPRNHSTT